MRIVKSSLALTLIATAGSMALGERPEYTLAEIVVPEGFQYIDPQDINDAGEVVGQVFLVGVGPLPFRWDGQALTVLATAPGSIHNAAAINSWGQIAGASQIDPLGDSHAMRWDAPECPMDLTLFGGGFGPGYDSSATAINEWGDAAGSIDVPGPAGAHQAFYWTPAQGIVALGTLGGAFSAASDLDDNTSPTVVGWSRNAELKDRAFVWHAGVMTELPQRAGTSPVSAARAVNNAGTIAGYASANSFNDRRAVVWMGGVLYELLAAGQSRSEAIDINENGDVVGFVAWPDVTQSAGLWRRDGTYYLDLNDVIPATPGLRLVQANAISDDGRIAVRATLNGQLKAFVLTPACLADANYDGVVNGLDVGAFLSGYAAGNPDADLNGDWVTNGVDVGLFLQAYAGGC